MVPQEHLPLLCAAYVPPLAPLVQAIAATGSDAARLRVCLAQSSTATVIAFVEAIWCKPEWRTPAVMHALLQAGASLTTVLERMWYACVWVEKNPQILDFASDVFGLEAVRASAPPALGRSCRLDDAVRAWCATHDVPMQAYVEPPPLTGGFKFEHKRYTEFALEPSV